MTYEEAKSIIENRHCKNNEHCRDKCMYGKGKCEYDMALSALEKQIPKKPYLDNDNGIYEKEYCPTCHRSLFPNDNHCICGQAIDWSDKE